MSQENALPAAASRIGFIGAGRVAQALSRAFSRAGADVTSVWNRSPEAAAALARAVPGCRTAASAQALVEASDIVFVCVSDDAIAGVAASVRWRPGVAAVHCSGAAGLDVLDSARREGALTGAFHPLLMFADPEISAAALSRCAIALEGDPPLVPRLKELAGLLGSPILDVPHGRRAVYHAASHYAAAFLCVLLQEGEDLMARIGMDRAVVRDALVALARSALDAAAARGAAAAMAGVYARADAGTAAKHLEALSAFGTEPLALYRMLAARSIELAFAGGRISAEDRERLHRLLGGRQEKR